MRQFKLLLLVLAFLTYQKTDGVEIKKQQINEIELAYYTRGNGDPLILIMGLRGTMAGWDPGLIEELAKNYTVILFDNRGAGMSTDTEENKTTIQQMAEDTFAFIKSLGYEKVNLLGWSMGSMIAMQLGIDHPEILKTLILCSPNPGGKHQTVRKTDAYLKLTSEQLSIEDILSLIYPATPEGRLAAAGFVTRLAQSIKSGSTPNDLSVNKQTIERQVNAIKLRANDDTIYERLAAIKVPTLVAGGIMDVVDIPDNVRKVASQIPYAWTAYFPHSGHAFISQDYLNFSQLIKIFISSETNDTF